MFEVGDQVVVLDSADVDAYWRGRRGRVKDVLPGALYGYRVHVEIDDHGVVEFEPGEIEKVGGQQTKKTGRAAYRALKNHLHNTLGLGRDEIRAMVREAVRDMADDEIRRFFETGRFRETFWRHCERYFDSHMFEVKRFVASELAGQYEVTVTKKASP